MSSYKNNIDGDAKIIYYLLFVNVFYCFLMIIRFFSKYDRNLNYRNGTRMTRIETDFQGLKIVPRNYYFALAIMNEDVDLGIRNDCRLKTEDCRLPAHRLQV